MHMLFLKITESQLWGPSMGAVADGICRDHPRWMALRSQQAEEFTVLAFRKGSSPAGSRGNNRK